MHQAHAYAAHGPAAIVYGVYISGFVLDILCHRKWSVLWRWITCGIIADSITSVAYLVQYRYDGICIPTWCGMGITALILVYITYQAQAGYRSEHPTYWGAVWVGVAQAVSFMPGISRLAITYAAGRMVGWSHRCSFMFTCALVVPLYGAYWVYAMYTGMAYVPVTWRDILLVGCALVCAWGLLYLTDYLYKTGHAWLFAVYVALMATVVYIL